MSAGDILGRVVTGVLVSCAIVVTAAVAKKEFGKHPQQLETTATRIADWDRLVANAYPIRDGGLATDTRAPVQIVEFADFQCLYCSRMNDSLRTLMAHGKRRVQWFFANYPLTSIHKQAYTSAVAADCAADQGRAAAMIDALYAEQSQLGVKAWRGFAEAAQIGNLQAFERCMGDTVRHPRLEYTIAVARALGIEGTPSFGIDGVIYPNLHSYSDVLEAIRRAGN